MRVVGAAMAAAVRWLRAVSGDDAYERYLEHRARTHAGEGAPLSRRAFYADRERRKWAGISRCC